MHPNDFQSNSPGNVIRQPNGYWAFIPQSLPPDLPWSVELVTALSRADRSLGELAGLGQALRIPQQLIQPFIRREAVLSSRIEGTRSSLTDLYTFEADQPTPAPEDSREVHNYVQVLQYGMDRVDTLPVSLRLIRELHARLMAGAPGQQLTPGEFRRSQNWIGPPGSTLSTAVYIPPPVANMQEALNHLENFIHGPSELPPLIKLALVHYQFEAIHPFLDGNGRVGRLLITLLLTEWGLLSQPTLYLSAYFEARRQAYYDHLLAISQRNAWEEWLLFFLIGVHSQAQDSIQRIRSLQTLLANYREKFQTTRAAARLLQIIDWLFTQPIFTIPQISSVLEVNYPTAQRYVKKLEAAGVVREITGGSRNRVYRADDILATIENPETIQAP